MIESGKIVHVSMFNNTVSTNTDYDLGEPAQAALFPVHLYTAPAQAEQMALLQSCHNSLT